MAFEGEGQDRGAAVGLGLAFRDGEEGAGKIRLSSLVSGKAEVTASAGKAHLCRFPQWPSVRRRPTARMKVMALVLDSHEGFFYV